MINQEVKGTLARLLATENLTVEHRKVSTAYFDVDKRLLVLPIWKTASNTVYDLLVGHEVGHALYTPNDPFGDAPKAFVNVIEDARIERLMKETYPGLRKSFFEGYKELWNDDFFGVKHEELEDLPLIDRINLYFKGNRSMPFEEDENIWVEKVANTKTFKDVVDLANEMYGHAKEKQAEKDAQLPQLDMPFDFDLDEDGTITEDEYKYFVEVKDLTKDKNKMLSSIPAIQPLSNKDLSRIASGFGYRIDPIYKTRKFHAGMDFSAKTGTPIYATGCLLYTSPSPRDRTRSRMPSSA